MHAPTYARRRAGGRLAPRHAVLLALALALLAWAAPAASAAPAWRIDALANSTAAPGTTLVYLVEVRNAGDTDLDGSVQPIAFSGTLPTGLTIAGVTPIINPSGFDCSSVVPGSPTFTCQSGALVPTQAESAFAFYNVLRVEATVGPSASGLLTSTFDIAGGDPSDPSNPSASTVAPATITTDPLAFGIAAFDAQVTADATGTPFTQAAGHPFAATTSIDFNTYRNADPLKGDLTPVEATKDIDVDLPPGFSGDPHGVGQCTISQLANASGQLSKPLCPAASQVGTTFVRTGGAPHMLLGPIPVFNMVPPTGAPAQFGFNVSGVVVTLNVNLRSDSDYGLTAHLRNISEGLALAGATMTLWGVPADPVHDPERACPGQRAPWDTGPTCSSGAAPSAFLRNPTSCPPPGVGLPTTLTMDSWVHPGRFVSRTILSHLSPGYPFTPDGWGAPQGTTGCDRVPFTPGFRVTPDTAASGQPSGYAFDITLPQSDDPASIGQADLKKAVVTLPQGIHLSASSAKGLGSCSPAQVGLHSLADATCPDGSKIGTVSITTPALPNPLTGSAYLATPHDNPFGTLVALYLVARGSGVTIKLPARVDLDPRTGQVTTTVDDNPQAPFSNVHVTVKGGARAALANPVDCKTYTTTASLAPWSGNPATTLGSPIAISADGHGAPCSGPRFSPGFHAGTESSKAGHSSPFGLQITREDTDQELGGLRLDMPTGLTGKIASVALCGNAAAAAGTCSSTSKIGNVTVGAGAGPTPFYIDNGGLYLTGPYKGAPYGLSVVVPAVAGPFDLGNVVVRQAIFVDKHDASLRVVSDPLPTIVQGVTLGVRDVRVSIDKPGFFLNSTSCAEKKVAGSIQAVTGQTSAVSNRYQAAECANLGFKPKMAMTIGGRGHVRRGQTSPLSTTLTMPRRNQANLRFVRVTLPTTINARLNTINDACTRAEFESNIGKCSHAKAGSAVASTPLLRAPLRGNVYFVKNGHPIPDLFVALRGEVDFDLIGRITIPGGKHLATTFSAAPDVPIRSFTLRLLGGPRTASIGAATNLCTPKGRKATAALDYIGQNGKVRQVHQRLRIRGCSRAGRPHRR